MIVKSLLYFCLSLTFRRANFQKVNLLVKFVKKKVNGTFLFGSICYLTSCWQIQILTPPSRKVLARPLDVLLVLDGIRSVSLYMFWVAKETTTGLVSTSKGNEPKPRDWNLYYNPTKKVYNAIVLYPYRITLIRT